MNITGKGKIQSEEARRQVGEQIPTFMRILAQQAAGGDMEKLEQMFQDGVLITEKYLPDVLAEMKRQSDVMMKEYWVSLPFYRNQANRQQDLWLRDFTKFGGESGLNTFWQTWIEMIESSIDTAPIIGNVFERAAKELSGIMLLFPEFSRWRKGESRDGNFWQIIFGDFEKNDDIQRIVLGFKEILFNVKEAVLILFGDVLPKLNGDTIRDAAEKLATIVDLFAKLSKYLKPVAEFIKLVQSMLMGYASAFIKMMTGDFSGAKEEVSNVGKHIISYVRDTSLESDVNKKMEEFSGPYRSQWHTGSVDKTRDALRESKATQTRTGPTGGEGQGGLVGSAILWMNSLFKGTGGGSKDNLPSMATLLAASGPKNPIFPDSMFSGNDPKGIGAFTDPEKEQKNTLDILKKIVEGGGKSANQPFLFSSVNLPASDIGVVQRGYYYNRAPQEVKVQHSIRIDATVEANSTADAIEKVLQDNFRELAPIIIDVSK